MLKLDLDSRVASSAVWPTATAPNIQICIPVRACLRCLLPVPAGVLPKKTRIRMKGAGALQCLTQLSHSTAGAHTQTQEVLQLRHRKGNPILSSDFSHFPTCLSLGAVLVLCSTLIWKLSPLQSWARLLTSQQLPVDSPLLHRLSQLLRPPPLSCPKLACSACAAPSQFLLLYKILTCCSALARFPNFVLRTRSKMVLLHTSKHSPANLKDDLHPGLGRAVPRPLPFKVGFHTPHSLSFNDELHPGAPQAAYKAGVHRHHGSCY